MNADALKKAGITLVVVVLALFVWTRYVQPAIAKAGV